MGGKYKMRRCFVHIGTHKTGTKSIQLALSSHWEELQSRKFLYPATGRPPEAPHGHHNLAWEVSGDSRFRKKHGSLKNLLDEISGSMHDVILSSEDFECSIYRPECFSEFIRSLQESGFEARLLVYFRSQIDYAMSLYLQLLPFGFDRPFDDFLNEVLERGFFRWRDWTLFFCYKDFLNRLEAIEGAAIIVKSFAEAKDSLISDYLSNFEMKPSDIGISEDIFLNKQVGLGHAIRMFCQNRAGGELSGSENQAISSLIAALSDQRVELSPSSRLKIIRRFADGNEYLVRKYHIAPFANMQPGTASIEESGEGLWMEAIFSAHCDLAFQKIV
jgi:hypothetical protein